ncbi:hypothetical protein Trco_003028 [Trichoderma cornu-damae]|uniref:Uncharacterized protein n=1 Tax=Trichoderma cornu-damae TaxID=654480 RepID=A0A9P8TZ42_9HYPO|nr:hypothetical protein Trco_003028 [Trichoderma cornu-damae]
MYIHRSNIAFRRSSFVALDVLHGRIKHFPPFKSHVPDGNTQKQTRSVGGKRFDTRPASL